MTTFKNLICRIFLYLGDPELFGLFFKLRAAKIYTKFFSGRIMLSTKSMAASGITRFIEDGNTYFEYLGGCYPDTVANGNAVSHIKDVALNYCKGSGLDIGSKFWPLPGAYAVDNKEEENAYRLDNWSDEGLDYVFSSHCLEHLSDWQSALKLWIRKIKSGGIIFLYLPHHSMTLWLPGSPWVGDDHVWSPRIEIITSFLNQEGMKIVAKNDGPDAYFSFYVVAKKLS